MIVMEQATFIREAVNPRFAPEWVITLREFTKMSACTFFENIFTRSLDLFVITDCLNLYIVICWPQKRELYLSKKGVALIIFVVLGISATFSGLAVKMDKDRHSFFFTRPDPLSPVFETRYTWVYQVVILFLLSLMTCVFYVFITFKIAASLTKSIQFLKEFYC